MAIGTNENIVVDGNTGISAPDNGIIVAGTKVTVSNNVVEDATEVGILVDADTGSTVSPNVAITGNTIVGDASTKTGILARNAPGVSITGNTILTGQTDGIIVRNSLAAGLSDGAVISGNFIKNFDGNLINIDGGAGFEDAVISGNVGDGVAATTVVGVRMSTNVQKVNIIANRLRDCTTGILETLSGSDWNFAHGNVLRDNTTPVTIVAANSVASDNLF